MKFVCYLSPAWSHVSSYTQGMSLSVETTISGGIEVRFFKLISVSVNISLSININVTINGTIPANSKRWSKLALYARFNQIRISLALYKLKHNFKKGLYYKKICGKTGLLQWINLNELYLIVVYR